MFNPMAQFAFAKHIVPIGYPLRELYWAALMVYIDTMTVAHLDK
jgi:hypothetical protein